MENVLQPHSGIEAVAEAERQPLLASTPPNTERGKDASTGPEDVSSLSDPPQKIMFRICTAMLSFFVLGIHTGAAGVLVPYLEAYYHIDDTVVSLLFVAPVFGYLVASLTLDSIHARLGRRGVAFAGATCQFLVAIIAAFHPSYTIFLLAFAVVGFGVGLIDAGWCAWAAGLLRANTISGFLHGSYSVGATFGPYFTASLIAGVGWPWYSFYWVMTVFAFIEVVLLTWAFRRDTGQIYRSEKAQACDPVPSSSSTKGIWRHKVVFICAAYLIAYVGVEAILGNWMVTFMLRVREATPFMASLCASGFWGGMALGRISLGSLTDRLGERTAVTIYLLAALGLEVLFSFLTPIGVAVVSITMLGFVLGPLFPTGIVMMLKLMPRELHVSAVAAVSVVGQVGGALFTFLLGATAERWGIQVLQPFLFVLLASSLGCWWCFPRLPAQEENSYDQGAE